MTGRQITQQLGQEKQLIREFAKDFNLTIEKEDGDTVIISGNGNKFEFKPKAISEDGHRGLYKDININKSYPYYNVRARLMQIFEVNKMHFS